jgi:hypothetical protein
MNPMVGPVCLSMGMISLALGIHDRITRSLFTRRYLVDTYTDRSASRLLRTSLRTSGGALDVNDYQLFISQTTIFPDVHPSVPFPGAGFGLAPLTVCVRV